ncbi:MAG: cohesin domain-containing protein [Euryarchaeota archaeon]|nr:cohesin domain-containing protein [Euryarchaeota archaeon]
MIKNILIGTVLVLVMITSAGATEVKVDPASQTIAAGDVFYVDVTVKDVVGMKGDAAILNFDPGVMQVTGIVEGDFLKAGGSTLSVFTWDNTAGTATFGYSLSGASTVTGSGTLATIRFDTYPDAPTGTYDLSLTDVELRDASNELIIPIYVVDGTVTILNTSVPVPVLSGTGVIVLVGMLAVVLAISVTRRERK